MYLQGHLDCIVYYILYSITNAEKGTGVENLFTAEVNREQLPASTPGDRVIEVELYATHIHVSSKVSSSIQPRPGPCLLNHSCARPPPHTGT